MKKQSLIGERDRRIVPRWRGFMDSIDLASGKKLFPDSTIDELSPSFLQNESDWRQDPSLWNALDFIAGAIVEGRIDLASAAIEQVRADARLPLAGSALINSALTPNKHSDSLNTMSVEDESAQQIRSSRKHLAEHPWDAIEWIDLARSFTSLGKTAKAARCIAAALRISPTNRFVVRAASRFYVHTQDPERAIKLLSKADILHDPWIMAPQIAISAIIGKGSAYALSALKMLKQDFSFSDLSELGAALGTLEVENGKIVHAKKLLRGSLRGANENSIAQVEWLNRARLGDVINVSSANPPKLYEARAWSSFVGSAWKEALSFARLWFRDQPFSGNAATLYSYVLSDIFHRYSDAERVLSTALRCNPKHSGLTNNMVVVLANLNRFQEAELLLSSLPHSDEYRNLAAEKATRGLLEFRKGNYEAGRAEFLMGIEGLIALGDGEQAGRAATHLALEEIRYGTAYVHEAVSRSTKLTEGAKASNVLFKLGELRNAEKQLAQARRSNI